MKARIRTKDGFYNSEVFALYKRGWNSAVTVFNGTADAIELVKIWSPGRNVFIYNTERSKDWVVRKNVEGYDWVLKNTSKKFFKTVINQSILNKCREVQVAAADFDWLEIKNQTDIDGLMECAFEFHDSYVEDSYVEGEKRYILFDTTWWCKILFELEGNIKTNLFKDFGREVVEKQFIGILDATMFFENRLIYWTNSQTVKTSCEIESYDYYFCAEKVKWKLIIDN